MAKEIREFIRREILAKLLQGDQPVSREEINALIDLGDQALMKAHLGEIRMSMDDPAPVRDPRLPERPETPESTAPVSEGVARDKVITTPRVRREENTSAPVSTSDEATKDTNGYRKPRRPKVRVILNNDRTGDDYQYGTSGDTRERIIRESNIKGDIAAITEVELQDLHPLFQGEVNTELAMIGRESLLGRFLHRPTIHMRQIFKGLNIPTGDREIGFDRTSREIPTVELIRHFDVLYSRSDDFTRIKQVEMQMEVPQFDGKSDDHPTLTFAWDDNPTNPSLKSMKFVMPTSVDSTKLYALGLLKKMEGSALYKLLGRHTLFGDSSYRSVQVAFRFEDQLPVLEISQNYYDNPHLDYKYILDTSTETPRFVASPIHQPSSHSRTTKNHLVYSDPVGGKPATLSIDEFLDAVQDMADLISSVDLK